jgi:hypothetical protein
MKCYSIFAVGTAILLGGCASRTIAPDYNSTNPNLQIGGERPVDIGPTREAAGSYCLEVSEKWHSDGKTPDGKTLWARDTFRKVVPCE